MTDIDRKLPEVAEQTNEDNGFWTLPDLSVSAFDDPKTPLTSDGSVVGKELVLHFEPEVDIWALAKEQPLKCSNYLSWNAFEDQIYDVPQTCYISEAGKDVFDAALATDSSLLDINNNDSIVIDASTFSAALLALGLGRSSIFFTWNDEKLSFEPVSKSVRISGYTTQMTEGAIKIFKACGNFTRCLQDFGDKSYMRGQSPGWIALADATLTVLKTLQSHLNVPAQSIESILQLQALFKPAEAILSAFYEIIKAVSSAKTDEAMLSQLYEKIQKMEHRTDSLRDVLLEVLAHVSRPFLDFAGEWMGIQREAGLTIEKSGTGKSFVKVEEKSWVDEQGMEIREPDFVLNEALVPSFISEEDARVMFEIGRSLRFMRSHHADHPLVRDDVVSSANPPPLKWEFSWQEIEKVEKKARQYEKDLLLAMKQYSTSSNGFESKFQVVYAEEVPYQLNFYGQPEEEMQAHLLKSMEMINKPLFAETSSNKLSALLQASLIQTNDITSEDDATFAPPISLTPFLSFNPIMATQARIVNATTIRLYFQSHNLREHLSLQRRFHLLGDGIFSSRLSHALFDPELETAERQAGVARTGAMMGLRLSGRDSWPPASSELRLALMGVLTETYFASQAIPSGHLDRNTTSLPGDLSFAVRDMSPEEIEKCLDPNGIEALDFLRLSYKPPPPLEAVITPIALYKYDQLFKLLLRVTRMHFVTTELFRDGKARHGRPDALTTRFRIEASHFVACVAGYLFDVGIDAPWRAFERKLDVLEKNINEDVFRAKNSLGEWETLGVDGLRKEHEGVLDEMLFASFLRKRQRPVMALLEEIFNLILAFSKLMRMRDGPAGAVRDLYHRLKRKIEVFLMVCRGMGEKKGFVADKEKGVEVGSQNTVVQLVERLEMGGYYEKLGR
jgi:hypothetical protein